MSKDDHLEFDGMVIQARGNGNFLVKVDDIDNTISCTLSGKIRKNNIKILEGDRVKIKVSTYSTEKGFIYFRERSDNNTQVKR